MSITKIAKTIHMRKETISNYLKSQGYTIIKDGRKHFFNFDYFNTIDSEEKAYWLGFLYADGYVNERGIIEITLSSIDKEHLIKFCTSIGLDIDVISSRVINNHECSRINIGSKRMVNDLIDLGCIQCKSLKLTFPNDTQVPQYLLRDFVRGYVDGDGWVGLCNTTPRISIYGTKEFLEEMIEYLHLPSAKIRKDSRSNVYIVEWGSTKAYNIINQLYKDSNIYLNRKYEVYQNICRLRE